MKLKTTLPRTGRPITRPTNARLKDFGPLLLLVDDVLNILMRYGAPSNKPLPDDERKLRIKQFRPLPPQHAWGRDEALLILKCLFAAPLLLNSSMTKSAASNAIPLSFARLFAEAPHTMIHALPKIERLLDKKMRTPQFMAAFNVGKKELWYCRDMALVKSLSTVDLPQTRKTIEKARELVRKKLTAISP